MEYKGMKTVYVFVRQDLPIEQQLVQANHAVLLMAAGTMAMKSMRWVVDGDAPNMIVIGVPNLKALHRVWHKLHSANITFAEWVEPDLGFGFTAIATWPLTETEKLPLANYRLWRYSPGAPAQAGACGVTPDGRAKADVAQLREHSVFNGGAEGENPSIGSKPINCT